MLGRSVCGGGKEEAEEGVVALVCWDAEREEKVLLIVESGEVGVKRVYQGCEGGVCSGS